MKQNLFEKLMYLTTKNPKYDVLFMVDSDVVYDNRFRYYPANISDVCVEEIYYGDEYGEDGKAYLREKDFDELVEYMANCDGIYNAEAVADGLEWEKAIIVYFEP